MSSLPVSLMIDIDTPSNYKLHVARWNGHDNPLDVYVRDKDEWFAWNQYRSGKDEFNRDYIFSIIDFYHENDTWLFGGIYRVIERDPAINAFSYTIEELPEYSGLVGRLKIHMRRPPRGRSFLLEKHLHSMEIDEVLREPYSGGEFPGYDNVSLDFHELEPLFRREKPDWKAALSNIKGVYVVFDRKTGKKYVGSAYGTEGIWSRWSSYLLNGHGWNDELITIISENAIEYAKENFRFTLLEQLPMRADDESIIARESFWKEALLSRGDHGYNKN